MSKRDIVPPITIRFTQEEDVWVRRHAAALGLDVSSMIRICLSLAVPQLMGNSFLRRSTLEDARIDPECR
jgi:hypothetical protein